MNKQWNAKAAASQNLNPLSPQSDSYCEKLYRSFKDAEGFYNERVLRVCQMLDIDTVELLPK